MTKRRARRAIRIAIMNRTISLIFLCFVFFITNYSINSFSKYSAEAAKGSSTNVAKWEVSLDTTGSSNTLDIVSGKNVQNYSLKVISTSEVSITYDVELSNLPDGILVTIDGRETKTPENGKITFEYAGSFAVNDANSEHTHTLTFDAPLETTVAGQSEIDIDVKATQNT